MGAGQKTMQWLLSLHSYLSGKCYWDNSLKNIDLATIKKEMEEFEEMAIVEETISIIKEMLKDTDVIVKRDDIDECKLIDIGTGEVLFDGYVADATNKAMEILKIKESEEK